MLARADQGAHREQEEHRKAMEQVQPMRKPLDQAPPAAMEGYLSQALTLEKAVSLAGLDLSNRNGAACVT